jgi:hypothetical protein
MKLTKSAIVTTALFALAATPAWANFLVNIKVSCTSMDDVGGQQKLVKESFSKDQIIQAFLDIAGSPVDPSSVELTYDSDFRRFHLIAKDTGAEVLLIGTPECAEANNHSGVTYKNNSSCVLMIDVGSGGIFGTALGTEKYTDVFPVGGEEKFTYKASYKGHFITSEIPPSVCTIQFSTGKLFQRSIP